MGKANRHEKSSSVGKAKVRKNPSSKTGALLVKSPSAFATYLKEAVVELTAIDIPEEKLTKRVPKNLRKKKPVENRHSEILGDGDNIEPHNKVTINGIEADETAVIMDTVDKYAEYLERIEQEKHSIVTSPDSTCPVEGQGYNSASSLTSEEPEKLFGEKTDSYYFETRTDASSILRNISKPLQPTEQSDSPKITIVQLKADRSQVLVGISSNISVYGCATIKVLKGEVLVFGSQISQKSPDVSFYAPRHDPAMVFQVVSRAELEDESNGIDDEILGDMNVNKTEEVSELLQSGAIILFSSIEEFNSLEFPGYPNLFNPSDENIVSNDLSKECYAVHTKYVLKDFPGYYFPCDDVIRSIVMSSNFPNYKYPIILTAGSKSSGKSTFNRYLVNSLLNVCNAVNYIDCDIGQPEFTPSGFISANLVTSPILGPPFTHLQQPYFCSYYGTLSSSRNPDYYVDCVKAAISQMKPGCPVILNTMGWTRSLGMNLLADTIRILQPSHVVQLSSRKELSSLNLINNEYLEQVESVGSCANLPTPKFKHFLIKADMPTTDSTIFNAAERRTLRALACLSHMQRRCIERDFGPVSRPLNLGSLSNLAPYAVHSKDVMLCVCHESGILKKFAYSLFNSSIVSFSVVNEKDFTEYSSKKFLGTPPVGNSVGIGLVRGIDVVKKVFYIVSGVPEATLKKVNCLSVGSLAIPEILFNSKDYGSSQIKKTPYIAEDFPFHVTGSGKFRNYKSFV